MNILRGLALLACTCPIVVFAASEAQDAVLAADRAFAGLSVERGQQTAFQTYLATDGVVFRPTAVVGRDWLATHEQASGRLEWTPAAAAVACSGQLAVSTGPWVYANPEGGEPAAGHYLSLWRQEPDGGWAVVLDHGIDHDRDATAPSPLQAALDGLWPAAAPRQCHGAGEPEDLAREDGRLNETIRSSGIDVALRRFAAAGALAYRDESPPSHLSDVWPVDDASVGRGVDARTQSAIATPGSDMGYTYGEIVEPAQSGAAPKIRAVYVRLWRHDGREWRVAVDMLTPVPPGTGP